MLGNDQTQDYTSVREEQVSKVDRRAERNQCAVMLEFEPSACNFESRTVHAGKHCAEIAFLVLKCFFQNLVEELLVTIQQGLMNGRLGENSPQPGVRVPAS